MDKNDKDVQNNKLIQSNQMTTHVTQTEGMFEGWAILELMGHRKLGGYVQEATVAGASFLRLDIPDGNDGAIATQFYSPAAVYCITPCTEAIAKQFSINHQPTPVTRWELPASESKTTQQSSALSESDADYDYDDDYEFNCQS